MKGEFEGVECCGLFRAGGVRSSGKDRLGRVLRRNRRIAVGRFKFNE